jgi:hypothetical protein
MKPPTNRFGAALTLALLPLVGCETNPEGPRAPDGSASKAAAQGQPTGRRPVTKNPREIVNPE